MEINDQNLGALKDMLQKTLSPDATIRKNAEAYLKQMEATQGYPILILKLIELSTAPADQAIRQSAGILFKNFVKHNWEEGVTIAQNDRDVIKNNIVDLMCATPGRVQAQISEALMVISKCDFPRNWPQLLPALKSKFGSQDFTVISGVLKTANAIFKQFRYVFKTNELFENLKYCLDEFQVPLLQLFTQMTAAVDGCAGDKDMLEKVLSIIRLLSRIFYSLNWQDLPEYFEDHMGEWMQGFSKFLTYTNPLLNPEDPDDDDEEEGPLDGLQASIVENLTLYAEKYEEEFEAHLQSFTQVVWQRLVQASTARRHDNLATTSIKFLNILASKPMHAAMFKEEATLRQIVESIIIPNMMLREADVELFEDNPTEFIRKDIEGSDTDSRRKCASDLLAPLSKAFEEQVSGICLGYVGKMLDDYGADRANRWRTKDCAISLVLALAVRGQTKSAGVTQTNPRVDVCTFYRSHIVTELNDPNTHPMVRADAIKFTSTLRNQLAAEDVRAVVPKMIELLGDTSCYIVHTYAAQCIERFLFSSTSNSTQAKFGREQLKPHLQALCTTMFGVMASPDYPENEYMMKTVMRVLAIAGSDSVHLTSAILEQLTAVLARVCKNPTNPTHSHFLFEALGTVVTNVGMHQPTSLPALEAALFPPFQTVLAMDVEPLTPYVFQLLAHLLEARPSDAGTSGSSFVADTPTPVDSQQCAGSSSGADLGPAYASLLPPLLAPTLWENRANTPALVRLLSAYFCAGGSGADSVVVANVDPILGVFQKLVSSRANEASAFSLATAVTSRLPLTELMKGAGGGAGPSRLQIIFQLLLTKLQACAAGHAGKADLFKKRFLQLLSSISGAHGAATVATTLDAVQPGLFLNLLQNVWLPQALKARPSSTKTMAAAEKAATDSEAKAVAVGLSRLLLDVPQVATNPAVFGAVLKVMVTLLEEGQAQGDDENAGDSRNEVHLEEVENGYSAGFSQLKCGKKGSSTSGVFAKVPDAKSYLARCLGSISAARPQTLGPLIQQHLDADGQKALAGYLQQAGAVLQ
jgi:exportin-2 (importin alpha re-exporter)